MGPMKILLVDDSKSARYALRLHLQHHGVQVDTAESAEAALESIAEAQPDAVLMDHTMPGMNGFEALDILKSDLSTAHIPVVMCTSHDDPAYSVQAIKRGALTVLTKADAADKLPQVLDQIRTVLAAHAHLTEAPSSPVPEPADALTPAPKPVSTPAPTRAEIEAWIDAHVGRHLAGAIEPHLARLTTQLRQVIAEQVEMAVDALPASQRLAEAIEPHLARLTTQLRQVIAEQVDMAVDALPAPAPTPPPVIEPTHAPIPAPVPQAPAIDLDHLCEKVIPTAVTRHFDSERDRFLQLVQQCVQETRAQHEEDPDTLRRILETVDATVTHKATQIARHEAEGAVQPALARDREALAALRQGLHISYALGAVALILGIGAAAAVFIL